MWLLPLGIFIQACVLFSLICVIVPRNGQEPIEVCSSWESPIAERCVIFIGHGFQAELSRARAQVTFRPNMFQWNGLLALVAGIPGHTLYSQYYPNYDSLLSRVDNVIYFGPESVVNDFNSLRNVLAFTYYDGSDHYRKYYNNYDKYVMDSFNQVASMYHSNSSYRYAFSGKAIIIIYLNSIGRSIAEYSLKSEETIKAKRTISKFIGDVERAMTQMFPTGKTAYFTAPDWRFVEEHDAELQAWGCGISRGYFEPVRLEDVCPLIASILGIPVPLGSLGKLPEAFMEVPKAVVEKALSCNALQLYQIAFPEINQCQNVTRLKKTLEEENCCETRQEISRAIIEMSQEKIRAINGTYDSLIFSLVFITLVGWITVILTEIMIKSGGDFIPSRKIQIIFLLMFAGIVAGMNIFILFTFTHKSYRYVLYYHLTLSPWFIVIMRFKVIWMWFKRKMSFSGLLYIPLVLLAMEMLVWFFKDELWAAIGISLVSSLPLLPVFQNSPYIYSLGWYVTSFLLISFIYIIPPVIIDKFSLDTVNVSGTILMCCGGASLLFLKGKRNNFIGFLLLLYLITSTILCALVILFETPDTYVYITSWCLLSSVLLPLLSSKNFSDRVMLMALGFSIPVMLTTKKLEPISYLILIVYVFLWVFLERSYMDKCTDQWNNLRRGFLLYFSCLLGYMIIGKLGYCNFYNKSIIKAFTTSLEPVVYFPILLLRYALVFAAVIMIYLSLIKSNWPSDVTYLYAYLLGELVCLRYLCQMYFIGGETTEAIFNHIFINTFTIVLLFSYIIASLYSTPLKNPLKKVELANEVPASE